MKKDFQRNSERDLASKFLLLKIGGTSVLPSPRPTDVLSQHLSLSRSEAKPEPISGVSFFFKDLSRNNNNSNLRTPTITQRIHNLKKRSFTLKHLNTDEDKNVQTKEPLSVPTTSTKSSMLRVTMFEMSNTLAVKQRQVKKM